MQTNAMSWISQTHITVAFTGKHRKHIKCLKWDVLLFYEKY